MVIARSADQRLLTKVIFTDEWPIYAALGWITLGRDPVDEQRLAHWQRGSHE